MVHVAGSSERALRLVPLLGGLLSLILFPRLSRRFQPAWLTVFAAGLFALSPSLIGFSAEFKPYSTDVTVALLMTLVAFGLRDPGAGGGRFAMAAACGLAAVWFSQPAVFVLAGLGAALFALALMDHPRTLSTGLVATLLVWASSAAAAAIAATHRVPPEMNEYLRRFWSPGLPKWPLLLFIALAAALLWLRNREAAMLLVGPVLVTLAVAAAGIYPFARRAILFLAPAAILALAEVAGWVVEGLARLRVPRRVGAALPAVALVAALALDPPVYRDEDTRPVLAKVATQLQPGDLMYVLYAGARAVRYYGPLVGLRSENVTLGLCHRSDPRAYLRDLDRFRGQPRVWVFRTHIFEPLAEDRIMDSYLERLGKRVESIDGEGVNASLWDLSNPTAPADAAETHPLPPLRASEATRLGCGHGPIGAMPGE